MERRVLIGVALAFALTACQWTPESAVKTTAPPARSAPAPSYTAAVLTPDRADRFDLEYGPGTITGSAPASNTAANLRVVGYERSLPAATNEVSCITWVAGNAGSTQPGIALRIRTTGGATRAIILTNNILFSVRWLFNVHLVDSTASPSVVLAGQLSVAWAGDPLPWRICGRAVGTRVTIKAWPLSTHPDEPAWDDPAYAKEVTVPADWVYAGRPGWYLGHLAAGETISYAGAAASVLPRSGRVPASPARPPATGTPTPRPG